MATSRLVTTELDTLIQKHTAFISFQDLLESVRGGYTPTIHKPRKGGEQKLVRMLLARGVKVWTGK